MHGASLCVQVRFDCMANAPPSFAGPHALPELLQPGLHAGGFIQLPELLQPGVHASGFIL